MGPGGRDPGDPSDPDAGDGPGGPDGGLAPTLALLLAGSAVAGGSLVFARRRRRRGDTADGDGATASDEWAAGRSQAPAAASSWAGPASPQLLRPATAVAGEPVPDPVLTGVVAQILPTEAHMPRWRRPSLKEARYQSERAPKPIARQLAFSAPAAPGVKRSTVRYDLVPLLDQPDEVTGIPIGELRAGDEVDVIGRRAVWVEVRTPTGRAGWLHRTTLETVAIDPAPAPAPAPAAEPDVPDVAAEEPERPGLDELLAAIVAERRAAAVMAASATEVKPGTSPARDSKPARGSGARSPRRQTSG